MTAGNDSAEYNVFRDSLLRYLGYCNEVGESFRYQFPKAVGPSYVISFGYCFADAASTGYATWIKGKEEDGFSWKPTAIATADTLLWQSLASVMVPGLVINQIVKASRFAVRRAPAGLLPTVAVEWMPTVTGLGSIPLIIGPIDSSVDYALDQTTRKWFKMEE